MRSVQNMVHASVSGWQESLVSQVRKTITGSQLPEHRVARALTRVNARRQWWSTEVELPWKPDCDTGELMPCTAKEAAAATGLRVAGDGGRGLEAVGAYGKTRPTASPLPGPAPS